MQLGAEEKNEFFQALTHRDVQNTKRILQSPPGPVVDCIMKMKHNLTTHCNSCHLSLASVSIINGGSGKRICYGFCSRGLSACTYIVALLYIDRQMKT